MSLILMLLGALIGCALLLTARWWIAARRVSEPASGMPGVIELAIGFVTNFLDTLGIGSFATTTTTFRLLRLVPDELIPGTMLVGHSLPVVAQALIFISVIEFDAAQMTMLIIACVAGGWIGAGVVTKLPRRAMQLGMGCALLTAATFMLLGMLGGTPAGGTAVAFDPPAFVVALVINVILGALVTLGIGNYAPSLVAFSLLGINPRAAFPIMAGSGGFVAAIAGMRFIGAGRVHWRAALGLTLGGIPGVLIAAWLVKSLSLDTLRWLVLIVIVYTAITLLRAGLHRVTPAAPLPVAPGPARRPVTQIE